MALLDRNHDYVLARPGPGRSLRSGGAAFEHLDPADARSGPAGSEPSLIEERHIRSRTVPASAWSTTERAAYALLGTPHPHARRRRAPAQLREGAGAALSHGLHSPRFRRRLHPGPMATAARMRRRMADGRSCRRSVLVYMDGSFATGDHEFADSVNNGPWGRALIEEFIPYLERTFRLVARPAARFLTGHSSGGWASLWLQVTYPDFFGGTWSTVARPRGFPQLLRHQRDARFRATTPIAPPPARRATWFAAGGKDVASWEQFARQEEVLGEYGGQIASFEWVFSPRGEDGRPMRLFNRVTGVLDQDVLRAWQRYDIRLTLEREWKHESAPAGRQAAHHLRRAGHVPPRRSRAACCAGFLKEKGSDAVCELVPGRDHMNLYEPYRTYPDGLELRIAGEMQAKFQAPAAEEPLYPSPRGCILIGTEAGRWASRIVLLVCCLLAARGLLAQPAERGSCKRRRRGSL